MAISRAQLLKELLPGLNALFGMEYERYGEEHKEIYETETSERSFEEETKLSGFSAAPVKNEGSAIQYDNAQEAWTARYTHETIAMGFSVTEEAMEDNLYDTFAKLRARGLARAMANTKQVKAADVFNNGFSSTYLGGDGVALFSASHPTVGNGLQSNTFGATDLSEAALESALITISKTKDDRGILTGTQADSLHIPPDLAFTADQILNSVLSTKLQTSAPYSGATGVTNVNNINSIRNQGLVPNGFFVNRRFTDTNAWFLTTDVPNGLKHFVRSPLAQSMDGDFDTGNVRYKSRERYSFGWSDPLGIFGSPGST